MIKVGLQREDRRCRRLRWQRVGHAVKYIYKLST